MARLILILIFIAAGVILIQPIFAKDATSSTARKEKVETKKTNLENRITAVKEKMATREAALKAKLAAFKDKRKAEVAERVNTNLNKINQNQTAQMLKHLDKMSALLDKVEARVSSNFPDSRVKIAAATEAVKTQAAKDYTLQVTSETTVRKDAESLRNQLKTDIQAVRKQVIDAKQSVSNAIRTARGQPKESTINGKQ